MMAQISASDMPRVGMMAPVTKTSVSGRLPSATVRRTSWA